MEHLSFVRHQAVAAVASWALLLYLLGQRLRILDSCLQQNMLRDEVNDAGLANISEQISSTLSFDLTLNLSKT